MCSDNRNSDETTTLPDQVSCGNGHLLLCTVVEEHNGVRDHRYTMRKPSGGSHSPIVQSGGTVSSEGTISAPASPELKGTAYHTQSPNGRIRAIVL
jgi:hypothetical protein